MPVVLLTQLPNFMCLSSRNPKGATIVWTSSQLFSYHTDAWFIHIPPASSAPTLCPFHSWLCQEAHRLVSCPLPLAVLHHQWFFSPQFLQQIKFFPTSRPLHLLFFSLKCSSFLFLLSLRFQLNCDSSERFFPTTLYKVVPSICLHHRTQLICFTQMSLLAYLLSRLGVPISSRVSFNNTYASFLILKWTS